MAINYGDKPKKDNSYKKWTCIGGIRFKLEDLINYTKERDAVEIVLRVNSEVRTYTITSRSNVDSYVAKLDKLTNATDV